MNWKSKLITHRGEKRIAVWFERNDEYIARIKAIKGSRWSASLSVWHVPDIDEHRIRFKIPTKISTQPSEEGTESIKKFKQWLQSKRYSENTIKTYCEALKSFLVFYRNKTTSEITNDDVIIYNNDY